MISLPDALAETQESSRPLELAAWVARLDAPETKVRSEAEEALLREGPAVVGFLVEALTKEKNEERRLGILFLLGRPGPQAPSALPALLAASASPSFRLRLHACLALGRLGEKRKEVFEALKERLGDEMLGVRRTSAWAFGALGPEASRFLLGVLRTLQGESLVWALEALRQGHSLGLDAVPILGECLAHPDFQIARRAGMVLRHMKEKALPVLPQVLALLSTSDPKRVSLGQDLLKYLGSTDESFFSAVLDLAAATSPTQRRIALAFLGRFPQNHDRSVPVLRQALERGDKEERYEAAIALALLDRSEAPVTEVIAQAIGETNFDLWRRACEAAGRLGPKGEAAVAALMGCLDREGEAWLKPLLATLKALGPTARPALDKLVALAERSGEEISALAVETIGALGMKAGELGPVLDPFLRHIHPAPRLQAWAILQEAGREVDGDIGTLVEILAKDADLRPLAARVLAKMGERGKEAAAALEGMLKDPDPDKGLAAAMALAGIAPGHPGLLPALTGWAASPDAWVRFQCAQALGLWGSKVQGAQALLEKLCQDQAPLVRKVADEARKIKAPNDKGTRKEANP